MTGFATVGFPSANAQTRKRANAQTRKRANAQTRKRANAQTRKRAIVRQSFLSAVVALAPGGEFSATSGASLFPSASSPALKASPLAAGAPPPAVKETPLAVNATPPAANQPSLSKRGAPPMADGTPLAADKTPLFTGDTPISRKTGHFALIGTMQSKHLADGRLARRTGVAPVSIFKNPGHRWVRLGIEDNRSQNPCPMKLETGATPVLRNRSGLN